MKYLSTFSGIGGFELGIQQAYETKISVRDGQTEDREPETHEQSMESATESILSNGNKPDTELRRDTREISCIGFSEIDKYAASIYQRHFPNHKNYGDITKINEKELPDFDILCGGFPCQSFSIAGKRRGFDDTRGTLFFEIARIIKQKQPRLLLLENVKGLLSHDKGQTFTTIISTLDELGYDIQWQVLNSKNHGVPQNRERVFIIGHLRGTSRPEVFPFGDSDEEDTRNAGEDLSCCLDANYHKGTNTLAKGRRQMVAMTEKRTDAAKEIRKETKDRDFSPRRGKYLAPRKDDTGNCVTSGQSKEQLLTDGAVVRRLTPTECERLQGFPDGWTEGVSDTQRYKTLGNAVTVNVIKDICERLL
jgi:DNA (cytosine-5)-methyltransferase 1